MEQAGALKRGVLKSIIDGFRETCKSTNGNA